MLLLLEPVARESLPPDTDTKVYPSITTCRIKEKGLSLWKFETHHCRHGGLLEQGKDFDLSCSPTISYPALRIVLSTAAHFLLAMQSSMTPTASKIIVLKRAEKYLSKHLSPTWSGSKIDIQSSSYQTPSLTNMSCKLSIVCKTERIQDAVGTCY